MKIKNIFLILFLFGLLTPAHAQVRQFVGGFEISSPGVGLRAQLISPLHPKDRFTYSEQKNKDFTILKEWIYAPSPNTDFGSEYVWDISSTLKDDHIILTAQDGSVVVNRALSGFPMAIIEPIIFWDRYGKKFRGQLLVDGQTVKVCVKAQSKQYPLRIDPSLKYGQWLGGNGGPVNINAVAYNASGTAIDIGGNVGVSGSLGVSPVYGTYAGTSDGFVIEVNDGGTPAIKWGQYLGGIANDSITSLAVNGTLIYAGGYTSKSTSWTTMTFHGTYGVASTSEGFVVAIIDGSTPSLEWGQWLGGTTASQVLALALNGSTVYAGGYTNVSTSWQTVTFFGTEKGNGSQAFIVAINDGGTPSLQWGQWLGGQASQAINALAVNGTKVYAGGYSTNSTSWTTTTFQGTWNVSVASEAFVVEINDGGSPCVKWGQWLGGSNTQSLTAMGINGATIYVGGYTNSSTSWTTVTFFGTDQTSSNPISFVVAINDGGTPSLQWGQWLGGAGNNTLLALNVSGTRVYAGGYSTVSTSWTTTSFYGTFANGSTSFTEAWVVGINDGGSPSLQWGEWLGGHDPTNGGRVNQTNALAVNGTKVYIGGISQSSTYWTTTTFQGVMAGNTSGFLVDIDNGGSPSLRWGQWVGGGVPETAQVNAMAVNGSTVYVGGVSGQSTSWATAPSFLGTFNEGDQSAAFVVAINDGGTPSMKWGQWLGGIGRFNNGYVGDGLTAMALNGNTIYAGGYSPASTSWTTMTFFGTYHGATFCEQGFVVAINDVGTPSLQWGQWLGGASPNSFTYGGPRVLALAVNGTKIYVGGYSDISTSWTTVTFFGTDISTTEAFVVAINDGGSPSLRWLQWLGGGSSAFSIGPTINALAVNGTQVYVGGYSDVSTSWTTTTFQGTYGGSTSEGYVVAIQDGGSPCVTWGQWLGGGGATVVNTLGVNGTKVYVGGYTTVSTSWTTTTFHGTWNASASEGFVVNINDGGTPSLKWGQWLGGNSSNSIQALAVSGTIIYAGGWTSSSTSFETVATFYGTANGSSDGFVVAIDDMGTPSLNWLEWLGGSANDAIQAMAVSAGTGRVVYAGGYASASTSWETTTFQGTFLANSEAFIVAISDTYTTTVSSTNDALFFDTGF